MYFLEYWLKNVLFWQLVNSMQNQVQSTKWHKSTKWPSWCDQPVGHPWSISVFKLHFFWLEFWTFYLKLYAVNLAKRQFEFVVFVSCIVSLYFILWSTLSVTKYILFYQLIEYWSSFAISWCRWNWSYDKDYIFGLVDLLCHITKNPNPNCKPVSGFQNFIKKCCS